MRLGYPRWRVARGARGGGWNSEAATSVSFSFRIVGLGELLRLVFGKQICTCRTCGNTIYRVFFNYKNISL